MQKSKTNKRTWLWLVCILVLFIGISYFVSSPDPKNYPGYVSNSPSPTGVKGFYTYLDGAKRWSHRPELLPDENEKNILVMVEPSFIPNSSEMEAYTEFMESGNTILLLQSNPSGMLGVQTTYIENEASGKLFDQKDKKYMAEILSPARLKTNEQDEVLLYDDLGTIAFKRSFGDGHLIVVNSPEWITNGAILEKDHLSLVLFLMEEGSRPATTILFDEYSHGAENAASLFAIYPKWMVVIAFQAILFTILWLWYRGKRFGTIMIAREETVRFSDERIKALAAWNLRGRNYSDSIEIQASYLKQRLQEKFGIPYQKDWHDIMGQLEKKLPNSDIKTFVTELTVLLNKEKITKQEYLLGSKKIDRIRKEVDGDEERANILTDKV